jgi:putative restriction endonuclease
LVEILVLKLHIYPTDRDWFEFLATSPGIDEVNFWRPGGQSPFTRLQPGDLFLFRLKGRVNRIAGGGVFAHSSIFPLNAAWEAFGIKNGTSDFGSFASMIAKYKGYASPRDMPMDSPIGCIILSSPFFFPAAEWIPLPTDYSPSLMQGKTYDATEGIGRELFERVSVHLREPSTFRENDPARVIGDPVLVRRRLGQGGFRVLVTDLYQRRCAVTGERTLPVLEAAHILPISRGGVHRPDNGLLLRSDIHKLFDLGYVTISDHGTFAVSGHLRTEWQNGRIYYDLNEKPVRLPSNPEHHPNKEWLQRHNEEVFRR